MNSTRTANHLATNFNSLNHPLHRVVTTASSIAIQSAIALGVLGSCTLQADGPVPHGGVVDVNAANWTFLIGQSDEFDSTTIDEDKWDTDTKDFGPWSWEPDNVTQKDGSLHLKMQAKDHQRRGEQLHYTSGMARNDRTITYGYFEARIKGCSRYPGACPSFWLYSIGPQNRHAAGDGETVAYSEIDVVELQQSEYDFESKQHFPATRVDCNLHAVLIQDGKRVWQRPNNRPEICKTHFDSPWDPREDYHVYGTKSTPEEIIWYIDGKEVGRKPNLYWHLPMHVTLSLGLRYPFVQYKDNERMPASDKTTEDGFPTHMSVDYVRVWRLASVNGSKSTASVDWTKEKYMLKERAKWDSNAWPWNQEKVEANFTEIDTNDDGIASGVERKNWYASKK